MRAIIRRPGEKEHIEEVIGLEVDPDTVKFLGGIRISENMKSVVVPKGQYVIIDDKERKYGKK